MKTILVVDDNPENLRLLSNILVEEGYKVRTAISGALALQSIQASSPDLVLLDVNMPNMSGYEVCSKLKSNERTANIPVIFLSALDETRDKVKGFDAGGEDYVTKPFHAEEVLARIKTHLRLKEYEQTLERKNDELQKVIEQLRQSQAQLIQADRMRSLTELLANIAHQWRQPLNGIGLLVQDFRDSYQCGELTEEYLEAQVETCMKVLQGLSKTIDDFGRFFTPDKDKSVFPLKVAIEQAICQVKASLEKEDISLVIDMNESLRMEGFPNEFSSVILNILWNSIDAFRRNDEMLKKEIKIETKSCGEGKCQVVISDNAGGIPEEVFDRVFEPYFTTKFAAMNVGVGLYMAKMLIEKNMGGTISIQNAEGGVQTIIGLSEHRDGSP